MAQRAPKFDVGTETAPWVSVRPNAETVAAEESHVHTYPPHSRELPRISIGFDRAPGDSRPPLTNDLEVTGTLGEGGMGVVLLARQHLLNRDVAIKTLKEGAPRVARAALLAEGKISGGLEHPSIIPVHALGLDENGQPVLVMKRVQGVSWQALLDDPHHPSWEHWIGTSDERLIDNLEILMQVCNAAHYAHNHGVIHRDIKPDNVLIGHYGEVYLVDWGLAARLDELSNQGSFAGTPVYAAPEMVSGEAGIHSDVYLLGATLHHVLVGKPRHHTATIGEALAAAMESKPYDYAEQVPAGLARIANRATSLDPQDRPADADAFRRELAEYLEHRSARALVDSAKERVAELRTLLQGEDDADAGSARRIDELVAEARFGLKQALALWQDNEDAATLLKELEGQLSQRDARREALGRLARDLDPKRASRQRFILFLVFATIVVGQSAMGVMQWLSGALWTAQEMTLHMLAALVVIVGLVIALRKPLQRSAVNRRGALLAITTFASVAASRALAWLSNEHPADILSHDLVLLGAIAVLGSAMLSRWFVALIALMPVCALLCRLWPQHAVLVFSFASAIGSAVVMLAIRGGAVDATFER